MVPKMPFNVWSMERIKQGKKACTSRTKKYQVPGVTRIDKQRLGYVRDYLWKQEGADSPEEFEKVWNGLHPRQGYDPRRVVFVHWFENPYRKEDKT